ncbi:MAG: PEGA domain-containing protein [Polyangiaceae bacterium]|nr:PEGA domain-containing protein [Polyangiaceae bacterium]
MRLAGLILLFVVALPAVAAGQDLAEAERLFRQGVELANDERWGEAAEYFRRARAISERPSVVCNLAFALYHLGQATEATEALDRCVELGRADPGWGAEHAADLAMARRYRAELSPAVGHLRLTLEPASARVFIDGEVIEGTGTTRTIDVDPGRHRLMVSAEGFETYHETFSVLSGASAEHSVHLVALPERPSVLVVESIEGARIFLDGEEAGTSRIEEELPAGDRRIRVEAEGRDPFERTVTLGPGERVLIDASFGTRGSNLAEEPALWIGIGSGLLLVGGAIALGVVLSQPASDPLANYGGPVDYVFTPLTVSF